MDGTTHVRTFLCILGEESSVDNKEIIYNVLNTDQFAFKKNNTWEIQKNKIQKL